MKQPFSRLKHFMMELFRLLESRSGMASGMAGETRVQGLSLPWSSIDLPPAILSQVQPSLQGCCGDISALNIWGTQSKNGLRGPSLPTLTGKEPRGPLEALWDMISSVSCLPFYLLHGAPGPPTSPLTHTWGLFLHADWHTDPGWAPSRLQPCSHALKTMWHRLWKHSFAILFTWSGERCHARSQVRDFSSVLQTKIISTSLLEFVLLIPD